jgi:hypothetical protein
MNSKRTDINSHIERTAMVNDSRFLQANHVPDEELAADQGISVEELRKARAKVLARAYAYILSWEIPAAKE